MKTRRPILSWSGPLLPAMAVGFAGLMSSASSAEPNLKVAAQSGGALRSIGRGISINDRGDIGFMAATEQGHNVFSINGDNGERRSLMNGVFVLKPEGDAPSQTFSEYVQMNNLREVAAQRRMNAVVLAGGIFGTMTTAPLTYVERWPYHGNRSNPGRVGLPNSLFAMGDGGAGNAWLLTTFLNPVTGRVYPSPFNQDGGFSAVMGAPAMNNNGQMVCSTLRGASNWFITTQPAGFLGASSSNGLARAQLADNGFFTLRVSDDINSSIYWFSYNYSIFDQAVHSGIGFGAKSLPGIDDAGTLMVFCADLSLAGAAAIDLAQPGLPAINPGPGLFWSKVEGGKRLFRRLAGVSNLIGSFNYQSRACVNQIATGFSAIQSGGLTSTASNYLAAFAGTTASGAPAVFTVEFSAATTADPAAPLIFVKSGESISGLSGTPVEFELHDAVSRSGVLACWTRTSSGAHAILTGRARAAKHLHVLTHGFGNASVLKVGPTNWQFSGFTDFLKGWEDMKIEIANLPSGFPDEKQDALKGGVVSYVSNWPSSDGWFQAVFGVCAAPFVPSWSQELLAFSSRNMARARLHAESAAERIVRDLDGMGMLTPPEVPQIHLIGHSRGAAVNARVARLLKAKGITPVQYTALDGYSPDWPVPSDILADLDIVEETGGPVGIQGMRRVNVRVDDGFNELLIRLIYNAHETYTGYLASWLGLPAPIYAESTVAFLKGYMAGWKAPERTGFDNYTITGCANFPGFTHHMSVTEAYTKCIRPYPFAKRALLDGPLGSYLLSAPSPGAVRVPRGGGGSPGIVLPAIRDGDFDELGLVANTTAAKVVPTEIDPVIGMLLTAMKRADYILSSSWDITGSATLVPSGGGYAARMEQTTAGTSLSQMVQIPATATALEFDLNVLSAKPEDTLQLMVGGETLGTIPLTGTVPSHPCLSLFGFAGKLGTLSLKLEGTPGATPAAITLDNIRTTTATGAGEPVLTVAYNPQDRTVDLTLTGTPGRTFQVQASGDLTEWTEIDSPMNFTGSKVIKDIPPADAKRRYYRVAW